MNIFQLGSRIWLARIGILLLVCLMTACQSAVPQGQVSVEPLVWPQEPAEPRIRFVKAVTRPSDLGIKRSFWNRLLRAIRGEDEVSFVRPSGVVARDEIIYVADPGAQTLWVLDPEAHEFRQIQSAADEALISPVAVTLGPKGRVYVADSYLAKVFVFDANGSLHSVIVDGNFQRPAGVAYDTGTDRLYVADSAAHRVWVFTGAGMPLETIGERGGGDGRFNFPTHVAVDDEGTLYVTDALGFRIQKFARDGRFLSSFGHHGDASGDFAAPKGVAVDSEGHIYVVDALFDKVQIFSPGGDYLLGFGERGVGLGQFWLPASLFIDPGDRVYVADAFNQRIQIFEYLRQRQPWIEPVH